MKKEVKSVLADAFASQSHDRWGLSYDNKFIYIKMYKLDLTKIGFILNTHVKSQCYVPQSLSICTTWSEQFLCVSSVSWVLVSSLSGTTQPQQQELNKTGSQSAKTLQKCFFSSVNLPWDLWWWCVPPRFCMNSHHYTQVTRPSTKVAYLENFVVLWYK